MFSIKKIQAGKAGLLLRVGCSDAEVKGTQELRAGDRSL